MEIYYGLYCIFVSIWILIDTPLQKVSRWWAFGVLIMPLLVPYYFIKTRPVQKYRKYIGLWLLGFLVFHFIGTAIMRFKVDNTSSKSSKQAAEWKTFVPDDKRFTAQFPTDPSREPNIVVNAPGGKVELIQYMSKSKDTLYAVTYGDFPSKAFIGRSSEQILDNARNGCAANLQGKITSEVIISLGNYPGREITIKVEPNTVVTAQIVLKNNRIYQVMVVSPSDKLFTSQRKEFFNSFKILS
ncbi:MAG: hypothetical protein NT140_01515 [Deltaproteobacteria bacterium]|nr:hypothetical protein [Deltaproteobacteria bacterium]